MSDKKQVSAEVKRLVALKGLALAELVWKLILQAGFGTSTALKIRDRDPFDTLSDMEKMGVAKVAISFLKGSDEIAQQFDEKIAKQIEAENASEAETSQDDIEEPASATDEAEEPATQSG